MTARQLIQDRIDDLKRASHTCGRLVLSGDVIGDVDHYFNQAGDEIGYVYRPFFKSETVVTFDVPRKWSQENKDDLSDITIITKVS